ncbi:MAG: flagellar export protein FliJ [bacterium]
MTFKFQNILNQRKTSLDKKYLELFEVQKRVAGLNLKIFDVQNSIDSFKKSYPSNILGISGIYDYNMLDSQFKSLNFKLNDLLKEKEIAEFELEDKKSQLITAKMEHEKIDKLREKYLAIDKISELKHEEAAAADFASNRYNQR